jgi:DNA polymerase IV
MPSLCRDCLAMEQERSLRRCLACGSPRLISHDELPGLSIAHLDCDAFYAAVEKRDDPSLLDKPVIIGGGKRGVVATACYIARIHGVRSAMPMFKALKACPQAVVIKPNMEKYAKVGRQVRQKMLDLTPLVEPLSIDEAFLDLSGTERVHQGPPAQTLARLANAITQDLGITVSIGLSHNKFLAKIASDLDKPNGFSVIGKAETVDFLRDKPVSMIFGVGARMQEKLGADRIAKIGDLRPFSEAELVARYGKEGSRFARLCRGIDARPVTPERDAKTISAETTFDDDLASADLLKPLLWKLCERVAKRLANAGLAACSLTLKLKTADFRIKTRSRSGFPPTMLAIKLYRLAETMLLQETDGTAFRLIGIGVHDFADPAEADRGDLVDTTTQKESAAASAIGKLRSKFGDQMITRGVGLKH